MYSQRPLQALPVVEPVLWPAALVKPFVVVVVVQRRVLPKQRICHLELEQRFRPSFAEQLQEFVVQQPVQFWLFLELLVPIGELQRCHQKQLVRSRCQSEGTWIAFG